LNGANDGRRLGIALDATHLAVAWRGADAQQSRWHSVTARCDGSPPSVERALADLTATAPGAATAGVTLIRPLAHTRALRLPRMARATFEGVLARDWPRHIIGHRATPHIVSSRSVEGGRWLAAFAPADLLEALADTASSHGWRLLDVRTSDDTLAGAARELAPDDVRAGECVVVLCDASGPADGVRLRGGLPWLGRRFLPGSNEADVAAFVSASDGAASAPVILFGHATHTVSLARALGAQGFRARAIDLGLGADAAAVELLAVAGMIGTATLPLRSPGAQQMQSRRMRATTRWLAVAAGVALVAALGLERWRVQRQLTAVQRARADIAAPVRMPCPCAPRSRVQPTSPRRSPSAKQVRRAWAACWPRWRWRFHRARRSRRCMSPATVSRSKAKARAARRCTTRCAPFRHWSR
jgi:hypothetical protein